MTKNLVILGSTGSIGRQTIDVCEKLPIRILALTAGTNVERMEEQCRAVRPKLAVMAEKSAAEALKSRLSDIDITVLSGEEGLIAAASMDEADTVLTAVVGMVGLKPTLAAIRKGRRIALANKETLVCAGELVMAEAEKYGAEILPVDSEHSAIFQCLTGCRDRGEIRKLILTCSGGPFFGKTREELRAVTRDDALRHPNWKMGEKITVDCATLMNKGLELIEAMRLYGLPREKVEIAIHLQSIVHSLVEYCDGAVLAQLGTPDMRLPIQYALTYPARKPSPAAPLDLFSCGALDFKKPDTQTFPCLKLAMQAATVGGTACAVLNGANEVAVAKFLRREIGFYDIADAVAYALDTVERGAAACLADVLDADQRARRAAEEYLKTDRR
ncbi:MAG: 1-deoxy-D-xylulose-5-phosphate reductoisomerase [Oscillospiraceae bacterium]|nr:1-deoxy-D-xylulose-5-phosphate reductoisomerase [Oscillospiraceae bacterium]